MVMIVLASNQRPLIVTECIKILCQNLYNGKLSVNSTLHDIHTRSNMFLTKEPPNPFLQTAHKQHTIDHHLDFKCQDSHIR